MVGTPLGTGLKLRHLEILLSQLAPHPKPKLQLEEYTINAKSAAEMLYIAGYINGDIRDKRVLDLGCGTGRLAIGAALLGAELVVGIDIDKENISVARENARKLSVDVKYIVGDIAAIFGQFDTTLTNPPFGNWKHGADILFLEKAMDISKIVYSLHKRGNSNRKFLCQKITLFGGIVGGIHEMDITIPHTFNFHRKKRYVVSVDLYKVITAMSKNKK